MDNDQDIDIISGTYSQGEVAIYENTSIIVSVEEDSPIPDKFLLYQNYPNPFNPSTKIKFTIPFVETHDLVSVQLKVYTVLGREVVTLINEEKPAGIYEVEFNSKAVTSGVYFYTLKAGPFIETKKMILLR